MPILDLRSPALREHYQLSFGFADTVSKQSPRRKSHQEHRSRADTETMIVDALRSASRAMTRLEIARAIGRAKTPYLISIIESLATSGRVVSHASEYRGFQCWKYEALK